MDFRSLLVAGALCAFASLPTAAGMITMDPSVFDPGTDITHAFEGADVYSASSAGSKITLSSAYISTCETCLRNETVTGTNVFSPVPDPTSTYFFFAEDLMRVLTGRTSDLSGIGLLVQFDEPTDYVQILGSSYWHENSLRMDYWDEVGNLLGTCLGGFNTDGSDANPDCKMKLLGNDPNYYDDQKTYTLKLQDPLIKFVTVGGHVGGAIVSKISFVKVPEPGSALTLAGSLLILAAAHMRRRKIS